MTTHPAANEVLISDVVTNVGVENVVIPLTVNGSPVTTATFYVLSASGDPVSIDPISEANLLASAEAINDLQKIYQGSPGNSLADTSEIAWNNVFTSVTAVSELSWLSNTTADLSGLVLGNLVTDQGLSEGAVTAFLGDVADLTSVQKQLALAAAMINDADTLLQNATQEYYTYVSDYIIQKEPINQQLLQKTTNDTLVALTAGFAASNFASSLVNDNPSLGAGIVSWANTFLNSFKDTIIGVLNPYNSDVTDSAQDILSDANSLSNILQNINDFSNPQNFTTALSQFAAEAAQAAYSPFNNVSNLAMEFPAVPTAISVPTTPNPSPVITGPSTVPTSTGTPLQLSSLFPATEEPAGSSSTIASYNLIFVRGSGIIAVNGTTYNTGSVIKNVTPAAFDLGYFYAATAGENEIEAVAVDSAGNYSVPADIVITATAPATSLAPVNTQDHTPPAIVAPSGQFAVGIGGSAELGPAFLNVTDANTSGYTSQQLQYTITSLPQNGYIVKGGSIVSTFTQADIDNNLISYQETTPGVASDSFSYYVSDPDGNRSGTTTLNIQVTPPPASTNPLLVADAPLTVGQGQTALITDANLYVSDPGLQPWQIIYHFTGPNDGTILPSIVQTDKFFTQQEVDLGLISYSNSGASANPDEMTFTVTDSQGGSLGADTLNINVIPKNNLQVDNGRALYLDPYGGADGYFGDVPGGTSLISQDILNATDPGVSPSNIVYTVQSLPTDVYDILIGTWSPPNGNLASFNPIGEIIPKPSGGFDSGGLYQNYFTQAEIDAGEVYVLVNAPGSPGQQSTIPLTVSDNVGNTISDLQLPVVLEPFGILLNGQYVQGNQISGHSASLTAAIGQTTVINSGIMNIINPVSTSGQDEYEVWTTPAQGTLLLNGVPLGPNHTFNSNSAVMFTQQEVDEGDLVYQQSGSPAQSDEFGLFVITTLTQDFSNGIEGILQVNISMTGTQGGQVLSGTSGAEILNPGEGNNYLFGDGNTIANYDNSPNPVLVNLSNGTVANGYGGTDSLTNIGSVVGSAFGDTFTVGPGVDTFVGGGGADTVIFHDPESDYRFFNNGLGDLVVRDIGGPRTDGTATLSGITYLEFADQTISASAAPITAPEAPSDFNGDGKADILWQYEDTANASDSQNGNAAIWLMNGTSATATPIVATPPADWHAIGTGDFNGDGKADILWQYEDTANASDPQNGDAAIWLMNGTSATATPVIATPPPDWHAIATGDFNGDGKSDILWQYEDTANPSDPQNGNAAIWLMNGTSATATPIVATAPPDWHVIATGDFNGDGKSDILWQYEDTANPNDPLNGEAAIWLMNGTTATATTVIATPPPDWRVIGTGDFNGDGKSDILWQYEDTANPSDPLNGEAAIWLMNGTSATATPIIATPPAAWDAIGTGDFNGDGKSDIIWQYENTVNPNDPLNGDAAIWLMNGTTATATTVFATPPAAWHVIPS